jgi:serine/threonine protein kinase
VYSKRKRIKIIKLFIYNCIFLYNSEGMVQIEQENTNWVFQEKLQGGLFTDHYLYQNNIGRQIIMKEVNEIFRNKISISDVQIQKVLDEAELNCKCLSPTLMKRKEMNSTGEIWRSYSEYHAYKLFDLIKVSKEGRLSEKFSRYYLIQLLTICEKMEKNGISYLPLRMEDLHLDNNYSLKISDFCLNNMVIKAHLIEEKLKNLINFIPNKSCVFPPEMLKLGEIFKNSLIFHIGVILSSIVTGQKPFQKCDMTDPFYRLILKKEDDKYWDFFEKQLKTKFSNEYKNLIMKMLSVNPEERIGLYDIKNHPWLLNSNLDDPTNPSFELFEYFSKLPLMKSYNEKLQTKKKCIQTQNINPLFIQTQKNEVLTIKYNINKDINEILTKIIETVLNRTNKNKTNDFD